MALTEFNGQREFDQNKFCAMILFFCEARVSRTRLCKQMFCSDFRHFKDHGQSISGSQYLHLPFGPQPLYFDKYCEELLEDEILIIESESSEDDFAIEKLKIFHHKEYELTVDERKTLEMIAENTVVFTTMRISNFFQADRGDESNTGRIGQKISYDYAKFLEL